MKKKKNQKKKKKSKDSKKKDENSKETKKKKKKKEIKFGITIEELCVYKTKELKAICKKYNLKDIGEKRDLAQRISMFLSITSLDQLTLPKKEFDIGNLE